MPKLTPTDKIFLENIGHSSSDIQEIAYAIKRTTYKQITSNGDKELTEKQAIDILGHEGWLRGIAISTFNIDTVRWGPNDERVKLHSNVYL